MTTTTTYQGLDSTGRSSSRVLQPPGGGSSISFGVEENVKPVHSRSNKTASNIFGPPVESQPVARRSNPPGGKSSGIFGAATTDAPDPKQRRNPPGGKTSGIFDTVKKPPNTLPTVKLKRRPRERRRSSCPAQSPLLNLHHLGPGKSHQVVSPASFLDKKKTPFTSLSELQTE
uniref:jupiter microtubule associated homolog 2-like isoform X2 n=1 Tax=Pristiophorus japonicus TaxID=55135 RepID=UPI00398E73C8